MNLKQLSGKNKEELIAIIISLQKDLKHREDIIGKKLEENIELSNRNIELLKKIDESNNAGLKNKYHPGLSWVGKIIFALTVEDHPLQTSGIISFIESRDIDAFKERINKTKYLSPNLVKAVKSGRIKKYAVNGIHGYFYALPQWFDKSDNLRPQYKEKEPIV